MGANEDQYLTIQRRSLKWWGISTLEEALIHIIIWIRNDEEDDEDEGSRRSLPKQIKISIQLSFHDIVFVMHLFIFNWCIMDDRMFSLMTVYYKYACDG